MDSLRKKRINDNDGTGPSLETWRSDGDDGQPEKKQVGLKSQ